RYNGIEVGRVEDLAFDPKDPRAVIATLQVQPGLHLRTNSSATIASEGLAGGSYVEIDGGTKSAPELVAQPGQRYPVIPTKPSTFEQLTNKINTLSDRANDLLNDENRKEIALMLANLQDTTAAINRHNKDIEAIL